MSTALTRADYSCRVMLFDAAPSPPAPRRNKIEVRAEHARRQLPAHITPEPRRITLAAIEQMLEVLPYGRYIASDGREILFNRSYRPIWERLPNGVVRRADSNEWIDWICQGWFGCGSMRYEKSAREAYRKVLRDFLDGKPLTVENERRRASR
jgi:hypothetical protein